MKKTLNVYDMKAAFEAAGRDYYTYEGLETLLAYYDEIDENMELDVIAICCNCTEYGDGAACSLSNLISEYGYKYTVSEWMDDTGADEYDEAEYIEALTSELENYTVVLPVRNGNYIVFAF